VSTVEDRLRVIEDRLAIQDCLSAYCRGTDRLDLNVLLSAYHQDAREDHGPVCGPLEDFLKWAFEDFQEGLISTHHAIHNTTFEFDGDTAHCETYWTCTAFRSVAPFSRDAGGRYVDRFEKRDGRWAIAARVVVVDWMETGDGGRVEPFNPAAFSRPDRPAPRRDRQDPSYMRPLMVGQVPPES
jgi:hypothetical protein